MSIRSSKPPTSRARHGLHQDRRVVVAVPPVGMALEPLRQHRVALRGPAPAGTYRVGVGRFEVLELPGDAVLDHQVVAVEEGQRRCRAPARSRGCGWPTRLRGRSRAPGTRGSSANAASSTATVPSVEPSSTTMHSSGAVRLGEDAAHRVDDAVLAVVHRHHHADERRLGHDGVSRIAGGAGPGGPEVLAPRRRTMRPDRCGGTSCCCCGSGGGRAPRARRARRHRCCGLRSTTPASRRWRAAERPEPVDERSGQQHARRQRRRLARCRGARVPGGGG